MIRYQNPYKYRLIELEFSVACRRTRQTLGDSWIQSFTISWSNWIGQGARGERGESARSVLVTEGPPDAAPESSSLAQATLSTRRMPLQWGRCNGSASSPRSRRAKPNRKLSSVAAGWPSSDEPPLWRRCVGPVHYPWSAGAPGAAHLEIKGRD
jgi:hypothetical protein